MSNPDTTRLVPTEECWCGCGRPASRGSFFHPGDDAIARTGVMDAVYGGDHAVPQTVRFMHAHGFGPGKRSAYEAYVALRERQRRRG